MKLISCVYLAAGKSERMGAPNKLLLPIEGVPLVRRTLLELIKFPFLEVIVVTGFESERVHAELASLPVRFIENRDYATGMHSSIRAGISSVSSQSEGFAVCLADQPRFSSDVLWKLAEEFSKTSGLVYPSCDGRKGNPVLISREFLPEILRQPDGDYGCSYLFKRHPEKTFPVLTEDEGVLLDLDTPEAYQTFVSFA